ncbi:MAG: PASTA domain-containing protein [Candidatus Cloacimonetes bacterium]|nr:PASTA domain-containing protein [Candidatus Cloacimonadota bacterium]
MLKFKALLKSIGIMILVFIVGFIVINIIMKVAVGHRNEVRVPNIVGMDFNIAVKKCMNLKLYLEQSEFVHHEEFEKGMIISQNPHPDIMTKKFRTINVVVSEGPEMVRIPYLYNLTITEAKLRLENTGLLLGKKKYRYSDDVDKDKIIYSEPMADDLIARKSEITVAVSLGKLTDSSSKSNKWRDLLNNE